jgi:hypothetical protein
LEARVESGVPRRDLVEEVGDEPDGVRVRRIDLPDLETAYGGSGFAFLDQVESSL